MQVFIENETGSDKKNIFDEKTLQYSRSHTVSARYPFPYGFLLNTTSGDGDNLDCFILSSKSFKSGQIIEAEPIGMFEQIEDNEVDHKILAVPKGDTWEVDAQTEKILREFGIKVFSHLPGKNVSIADSLELRRL